MNNQQIQKALAGLLIIQNENLKVQNPTIYRGFKQAQDALTEMLKPDEVSGNIEQLKTAPYILDFLNSEGREIGTVFYKERESNEGLAIEVITAITAQLGRAPKYPLKVFTDVISHGGDIVTEQFTFKALEAGFFDEPQPSGNIEQLITLEAFGATKEEAEKPLAQQILQTTIAEVINAVEGCTHPHWTETPTKNLIIKTCSTCGAQKYE